MAHLLSCQCDRRASLIGEIVLTGGAAEFGLADLAVLDAAAEAQRTTGAALMLIVPPDRSAHYVQRLLSEQLVERLNLGAPACNKCLGLTHTLQPTLLD